MEKLKIGKYKHFKGKMYEVVGEARHSETMEEFVVYRALYDQEDGFDPHNLWVRPKKMFLEEVERDGYKGPRFEYVG